MVAAHEAVARGRRVIIVDQEGPQNLGGQAFWSLGGLFMVDTPEQRRVGLKDSRALAQSDWLGSAQFDRPEDAWPRKWAQAYLNFAAGEMRDWLHGMGMRWFPVVGWAERGGAQAAGHGNSIPRFHLTWGTGPGVLEPFLPVAEHANVEMRYRHRVNALIVEDGRVVGASGDVLEPSNVLRGASSPKGVVGDFEIRAESVPVDRMRFRVESVSNPGRHGASIRCPSASNHIELGPGRMRMPCNGQIGSQLRRPSV